MYVFQMYVCVSFPFGFEGGMWDLIIVIPDHCLSIYFSYFFFCIGILVTPELKKNPIDLRTTTLDLLTPS